MLAELSEKAILDSWRTSIDAVMARQKAGGGELTGPNPTDRGKPETQDHLLPDGAGWPLYA
ncbi:hypothetical protein H488_0104310 [Kocuria sp. UCD-OTCP]|nr:hypothetical protein H488_0104310 [Kocuria sp. UCD-OTCP]